ncbi:MAG: DUF4214 domain-containing protein [Acidimicrobiia bacterium]|nr:DUF4214 domain-containing protein [Acidimicrobiia bacterium]
MFSSRLRRMRAQQCMVDRFGQGVGRASMLAIVLLAGLVTTAAAQPDTEGLALERRSAPAVVETVDGGPPDQPVPALHVPVRSMEAEPGDQARRIGPRWGRRIDGTMTTTYQAPTPAPVRRVIDAAVATWDESLTLSPSTPLEISVLWTDLGPRLLGQAGTEGEYRDAEQFPTDRWYPAALANQLARFDINGPETPEIMIELNSQLGDDWYVGTEGRPAFGQIDLFSVVLHEIAHGLGFLGSAAASRSGTVSIDHSPPSIYDDYVLNGDGVRLVDLDRTSALDALTSGMLRFDIGFGRTMPLSSPERFVNGSSYSHFDESIPEVEAGAMMTPALNNGEVQRHIDAAVLGVLDQIGWDLDTSLITPSIADIAVTSGEIEMVWSEDWSEPVTLPDQYEIRISPSASSGTNPAAVRQEVQAGLIGSIRVPNLQNGTTYDVAMRATRPEHLEGSWSQVSVLMPPNPNRVRDLATGTIGAVTLTWDAPIASGEPLTGYEIQYREASSPTWISETQPGTAWTSSLPQGRYWFRVRGLNRIGDGLWNETGLVGLAQGAVRPMPLDGQIGRLYEAYFNRTADRNGMAYWREVRSRGVSLDVVARSFAQSTEFGLTYGEVSDRQFIRLLYRNVLDRLPDPAGNDYWLDLLRNGASRSEVVLSFSESPEFIRITETAAPQSTIDGAIERLHIALLRRVPTQSQLAELRRGRRSIGTAGLRAISAQLRRTTEFEGIWDARDELELLENIADSVVRDERLRAALISRLADGESVDTLLVELTETPSFIAATGTAP